MNNDLQSALHLIEGLVGKDTYFPDMLHKLRPILAPREQKIIDLMIKFQEIMVLIDEINE